MNAQRSDVEQQRVFMLDEVPANLCREELINMFGNKGAGLIESIREGFAVPKGFIIPIKENFEYQKNDNRLDDDLISQIFACLDQLEMLTGKEFTSKTHPLTVACRSTGKVSMPGMMETVTNVGMSDAVARGMALAEDNPLFAYDTLSRYLRSYGENAGHIPGSAFESALRQCIQKFQLERIEQFEAEQFVQLCEAYKCVLADHSVLLSHSVHDQLLHCIAAVFESSSSTVAKLFREDRGIVDPMSQGTAVIILEMVYGNRNPQSAALTVFTRNLLTGEHQLDGEWLSQAQGNDLVAGIKITNPITSLREQWPEVYDEVVVLGEKLERKYGDSQEMEITVEYFGGKHHVYLLQTRKNKPSGPADVRMSVDMVREGLLSQDEALLRLDPSTMSRVLLPQLDRSGNVASQLLVKGEKITPSAGCGKAVFDCMEARRRGGQGEKIILIAPTTTPHDGPAFPFIQGIVTSEGGPGSHAAMVALNLGIACVVGAKDMVVDVVGEVARIGDLVIRKDDIITVDGATGEVYLGQLPLLRPDPSADFYTVLDWARSRSDMPVWLNACNATDAAEGKRFGAQGIGLFRTEESIKTVDRLEVFVRMVLAEDEEELLQAIDMLYHFHVADFLETFRVMAPLPVVVRLFDPPLDEYVKEDTILEQLRDANRRESEYTKLRKQLARAKMLHEDNPMLGVRGVRLGITTPELYQMQIRAVFHAVAVCLEEGLTPRIEIMVPQVVYASEVKHVLGYMDEIREYFEKEYQVEFPIGLMSMIETPRACVTSEEIVGIADACSFGSNDLTQFTNAMSRNSSSRFFGQYEAKGIMSENPFKTLDQKGAGELMRIAINRARHVKPKIKLGLCGEHGGDVASARFFRHIGGSYVSCSKYSVPTMILALACETIRHPKRR